MSRDPFSRFGVTKRTQLITKSDQWFDDTQFVYRAERLSAALYLGGFVLECLLKAALWERRTEDRVRNLLFSHDLSGLLEANTDLASTMRADPLGRYEQFVKLSSWTVRFRYNPKRIDPEDARIFLDRLKEVRAWLRSRI